ncbi:MAG TPA: ABC transporter ATP-binding protein, partial [Actinopolymorphaceae bacterium]|nr:ABC transporter ATP-binding protein [Actinopolymorphaceae bacterium]
MPSDTTAPGAYQQDPSTTVSASFDRLNSLWRLRSYLRPYLGRLILMLVAALVGVAASLSIPLVTKEIIDGPIAERNLRLLVMLGILAVLLGIAEAFLIFVRRWIQSSAVLGLETAIRDDLYAHLQRLPMAFHGGWQSGQLLSRATTDLSVIRRFLGFGILFLITNVVQLSIVAVLLLHMYWPLGLVVAASVIPIVILSGRFERRYIRISRQVQDQQGDLATVIEEGAVGIRVIKSFGRRHHVYDNFDEGACNVYATSMEKVRVSAWFWTVLGFVPNVTLAFVLLLGALAVGRGALSLGTLVAFTTLTLQLVWPIASLGHILAMAQESMTAADRVMEVLDTEPAINGGTKKVKRAAGHLRFEGVGFRFPDGDTDVLRKVWLEVEPGETLAVVGATGSGKTTLTGLVPRLYDVTAGRVTIDGHDIRDLTLPELRSIVATAFEEPTLFSMSVRENLTLGRTDATDEEIASALEVAQATFVYNLPWGLDTRIGEQG